MKRLFVCSFRKSNLITNEGVILGRIGWDNELNFNRSRERERECVCVCV